MSALPPDDALQRPNYFNGQRLTARDLRAEQRYHTANRHERNRVLYASGIAAGLEVVLTRPNPSGPQCATVMPGLAIDPLGREIYLPNPVVVQFFNAASGKPKPPAGVDVELAGVPSSTSGVVFGNLLAVSYREASQSPAQNPCVRDVPHAPCSGDQPWGSPTRIVASAQFELLDTWPNADSGRTVLGQVELDLAYDVVRILPSVRRYAERAPTRSVQPVSLSGEKDIDQNNSKVLVFHIIGEAPQSALLYLRGGLFNNLHYTEMGQHAHHVNATTDSQSFDLTHHHDNTGGTTDQAQTHTHAFYCDPDQTSGGIDVNTSSNSYAQNPSAIDIQPGSSYMQGVWTVTNPGPNPITILSPIILPVDGHTHTINAKITPALGPWSHTHIVQGNTDPAGATGGPAARTAKALTTLADLVVTFDMIPITASICDQLEARPGQAGNWRKVKPGQTEVRLNGIGLNQPDGTGEIDLLKLGIDIGPGYHRLEFSVRDPDAGGQLQYDLYIS